MKHEDYIKLYELLSEYEQENKQPEKTNCDFKTIQEYQSYMAYCEQMKAIHLLKELIGFEL